MELFRLRRRESERDEYEDRPGEVIATSLGEKSLNVTVRRPDGSLYEYGVPRGSLDVIFTPDGVIDLRKPDENH